MRNQLAQAFEEWQTCILGSENNSEKMYELALNVTKGLRPSIPETHRLLQKYINDKTQILHIGDFISAMYNQSEENLIIYDSTLSPSLSIFPSWQADGLQELGLPPWRL